MKVEFSGELIWIDPKKIIRGVDDDMGSFFLGLATVFNDLKSIMFFDKLLSDHYRQPPESEVSIHSGNCSGLRVYLQKLMASTINEFFIFLKKNKDIIKGAEFSEISNRIPKEEQNFLRAIIAAANGQWPKVNDFLHSIVQIRSNVAFHYDHSGEVLRRALLADFFQKKLMIKTRLLIIL